ncbi:MAG: peptide-methionine (R)-S-oxide reductase MsrB [bacterium]
MQKNLNLTKEQEDVLFSGATEAPGSGKLLHNTENGIYSCANCGSELFMSNTKFDSGSGWPSFYKPKESDAVVLIKDSSLGMERVEAVCKTCGGHLGHVFDDAYDQPSGQRYCINSLSLSFKKDAKDKA